MSATGCERGAPAPSVPGPVLLFDGECGLCQACVRALIRMDRAGRLHFAPLQSPPAQAYLRAEGLPTRDFESLVFVPDWTRRGAGGPRRRTDGLFEACAVVGGFGRELANLRALPRWARDLGYRLIGRSRYALFGPARADRWRPEHRARMLPGAESVRY